MTHYEKKKIEQNLDDLSGVVDVFFNDGEVSVLVARRRLERVLKILQECPNSRNTAIRQLADEANKRMTWHRHDEPDGSSRAKTDGSSEGPTGA